MFDKQMKVITKYIIGIEMALLPKILDGLWVVSFSDEFTQSHCLGFRKLIMACTGIRC